MFIPDICVVGGYDRTNYEWLYTFTLTVFNVYDSYFDAFNYFFKNLKLYTHFKERL